MVVSYIAHGVTIRPMTVTGCTTSVMAAAQRINPMTELMTKRRNVWTSEQARIAGRKGGKAWRVDSRWRSDDYKAGYTAGWKAGTRSTGERHKAVAV